MSSIRSGFGFAMTSLLFVALACGDDSSGAGGSGTGATAGSGNPPPTPGAGEVTRATNPGDLLLVDPDSGSILGITPAGEVFEVLSTAAIESTTGVQGVNLDRKGIAIDPQTATAYFSEQESGALIALPVGGPSSVIATREEFVAQTGGLDDHFNLGVAFSNGALFVTSNHNSTGEEDGGTGIERIFRVAQGGGVTVFAREPDVEAALNNVPSYDTEQAITAFGGTIYVANTSSANPPGVIAFGAGGGPSLLAGTGFSADYTLRAMCTAPNGDVVVWDDGSDSYKNVSAATGAVSELVSAQALATVPGADPDGGCTLASDGTVYASDDQLGILRYPPPYTQGEIWVDTAAITQVTGAPTMELDGGIVFHP